MDFLHAHPSKKPFFFFFFIFFLTLSFLSPFSFYITSHHAKNIPSHFHHPHNTVSGSGTCPGIHEFDDYASKCVYVKTHSGCQGDGYLNYLEIFYCTGQHGHVFGYLVLVLWLVILFYLLGHTASKYFCPSVESLSTVLKLPPTIAGTTLLPFGNGANDVFSSIISFTQSGGGVIGLNSVLGGAFFICCVVVGIVSIAVSSREVTIDRQSFVRDVLFFLFVLCCLLVIIAFGQVTFWFALCFASLYVAYIILVSVMQMFCYGGKDESEHLVADPMAVDVSTVQRIPLLGYVDEEEGTAVSEKGNLKTEQDHKPGQTDKSWWSVLLCVMELPLDLPRMLTIPFIGEEKWSKPLLIASLTLAPILFAAVYATHGADHNFQTIIPILTAAIPIGLILGTLALIFTDASTPAKGLSQLPWLTGGFLMSIVWTYVTAEELVSLLVQFGDILGISPAILGFTVLAWGNSLGDLISDVAMAVKGGPDGAQVAVSGCYAGSLFNTLVGLGLSMVFAAWEDYPSGHEIPGNAEVVETVGFLMGALLWALVVLPKRNMQPDRYLGVGLLVIYFCFLLLRLVKSVGLLKFGGLEY